MRISPLKNISPLSRNTIPTGTAPQFTANPVITAAAFEVGQTLTCSDGTVTGTDPITYSYQWYRGVTPIGADQNTYVAVFADAGETITCDVTATNAYGVDNATSNGVYIFDVDAQIYIDALTTAGMTDGISTTLYGYGYETLKTYINAHIVELKNDSIWNTLNFYYLHVGSTAAMQGINVVNPGTNNISFFNTIAGDFTATGWLGNGSNSYGATGFMTGSLSNADNHIMCYSRTAAANGGSAIGVEGGITDLFMYENTAGGQFQYRNNGQNILVTNGDGSGIYIGTARSSTDMEAYHNGATIGTNIVLTVALPNLEIYVGAQNNNGGGAWKNSSREYISFSAGSKLTTANALAFSTSLNDFQTLLNRNIY